MFLTAQQKRFIKKNYRRSSIDQIANELAIPSEEIFEYLKKYVGVEKLQKLQGKNTDKPADRGQNPFKNNIVYIILATLIIIGYLNTLGNDFVSDDIGAIVEDKHIGDLTYLFIDMGWLRRTFYFVIYHLWGLTPAYYRLLNILFHFGSSLLVFFSLEKLTQKRLTAILAAILFAVHPIMVESVTWISGGPYTQYTFFLLASFYFYLIAKEKNKYYYYSLGLFALALFSSEKAFMLPFIILLYELAWGDWKTSARKYWPYLAMGGLFILYYVSQIGSRVSTLAASHYDKVEKLNPFEQIPIAIYSYLKLLVWPKDLSLYQTEMVFSTVQYLGALMVFLLFLAAIIIAYEKSRPVFFGLALFIVALLPTLTPFGISWIVAERYVYLSTIGIFFVVALMLTKLIEQARFAKLTYIFFVLLVLSLTTRTIVRNLDWNNQDTLWVATVKVAPSGHVIHNNLGDMYGRHNEFAKSIAEFKKAIEINPQYADAYHNLGNTYITTGNYEEAIASFQKAIELNPGLWQSHQQLAGVYFEKGDKTKAKEVLVKALEILPNSVELRQSLSLVESKQ